MSENYVEEDSRMIIEDNIMQFDKNVVQLSNVSCLKIAPMPKKEYPIWTFIAIIIGILFITRTTGVGLLILAIGVVPIIWIYKQNTELGNYLVVSMNSGDSFYFSCNNSVFLENAQEEIKKCFNGQSKTIISFQNCQIDSSQIGTNDSAYISRR